MKRFKELLELGNAYAAQSDWKDFALVKVCLCALGVMIGVKLPRTRKRLIQAVAGTIFGSSYFFLMVKVINTIRNMQLKKMEQED